MSFKRKVNQRTMPKKKKSCNHIRCFIYIYKRSNFLRCHVASCEFPTKKKAKSKGRRRRAARARGGHFRTLERGREREFPILSAPCLTPCCVHPQTKPSCKLAEQEAGPRTVQPPCVYPYPPYSPPASQPARPIGTARALPREE